MIACISGACADTFLGTMWGFHRRSDHRHVRLDGGGHPFSQQEMKKNVLDFSGALDIIDEERRRMDWVVASIHNIGLKGLENPTAEKCTQLWLNIAHDPVVNVIGHSGSPEYRYDYDTVIPEFGRCHKLVEINAHSFEARPANIPCCREIALCCKKYGVPINR